MRVLLIDDDARLAELLEGYLTPQGVTLVHAGGGQAGLAALAGGGFDAIFLDVMMPGMDGLAVLRKVRDAGHRIPVLMLTARGDEADRVVGLELGADDYVAKPFSPRELLARIRATVRRVRGQAGPAQQSIQVGALVLDPQRMTVMLEDKPVDVTAYEFAILRALAQRPGRVLSREQLLDLAKGSAELSFDRSIDVHVSRLRAKLGDDSRSPRILKTVRGVGYLLAGGES